MISSALIKEFLDACFLAKEMTQIMPQLPAGLTPRHIYILDKIHELSQKNRAVKISDVSDNLRVTKPGITKLIHELTMLGMIQKNADDMDKRVTWLHLTPLGEQCHQEYFLNYHQAIAQHCTSTSEQDLTNAISTIKNLYWLMKSNVNR